jgi:hypothetical protein
MPLQATSGAASQDAFGGNGVAVVPAYIEDVFSCFLYTGTGANQTITNNIDLSTNGGLVWIKQRSLSASHRLFDTARGATKYLTSSGAAGSATDATSLTAFNSTGFSLGNNDAGDDTVNGSTYKYASWTFRKQPKFFDIQTWTGDGANRTISHSLGSVPACILVKRTSSGNAAWAVYHRSLANTQYLVLNDTAAAATGATWWNSTTPTSTVFSLGTDATVNESGKTYIAYIFAHDAGGFGLTGTDNVISCGTFTPSGGAATINLGYEPQWILSKVNSAGYFWRMVDNMRGIPVSPPGSNTAKVLYANASNAEADSGDISPTATGFTVDGQADFQTIYIAIRRGPMKVPTTGTSVFAPVARIGTGSIVNVTTPNFAPDLLFSRDYGSSVGKFSFNDKLRGPSNSLYSTDTAAEVTTTGLTSFNNLGYTAAADGLSYNESGDGMITECFQRAPSFMDVVCWTGTGSATTFSHNLQAVPELMIVKRRSTAFSWTVYAASLAATEIMVLNTTAAIQAGSDAWNSTRPTSSVFSVSPGSNSTNASGSTYVAYLFATCAGVSKVGSYTGTATTKQIDCGFTAGARFVLIKRTDDVGDWYVWDTARGIIAGNDPYLLLNSTAAEVTSTDYIDTYSAGFEISSTAPAAINANGGTYIFLAIA